MKIAIIGESPTDEKAIAILIKAILQVPIEPMPVYRRAGGWNQALEILPALIRSIYYNEFAEGLVIVVDSNLQPVHLLDDSHFPAFCLGKHNNVTEAAWFMELEQPNSCGYTTKELKRKIYLKERLNLTEEIEIMETEARRISLRLDDLRTNFANGFGLLVNDLKNWI